MHNDENGDEAAAGDSVRAICSVRWVLCVVLVECCCCVACSLLKLAAGGGVHGTVE